MDASANQNDNEDRDRLTRVGGGDREALAALYRTHRPTVIRFLASRYRGATAEDLEDVAHEVFVSLLTTNSRFRGEAAVATYLLKAAQRILARHLERNNRRRRREEAVTAARPERWTNNEGDTAWREAAARTRQAIEELPGTYRQAVTLIAIHGMRVATAARLAGCTVEAMRSRYRRAREYLASQLTDLE